MRDGYKVLNYKSFQNGRYKVYSIEPEKMFSIMKWRNEQIDILRQDKRITEIEQKRYFREKVIPEFQLEKPSKILLSFYYDDEFIGYGGLVHISWVNKRGEVSFLIKTERNEDIQQFKIDYTAFLNLISLIAFDELEFVKITTEAFDLRPYLIQTLESNGFIEEGRLKKQNIIKGKFVDSLLHAKFRHQAN